MSKSSGKQTGNTRVPRSPEERSAQTQEKASRDLNAVEREQLALSLRLQGYDFERIAAECQYFSSGKPNGSAAYKAYKRALARIPRQAVEEARQRMTLAYDNARRALWADFITGEPKAIEAWLAMDEREAKLFGLDTQPKQQQISAPKIVIRTYGAPDSPVNTDLL